MKGSVVDITGMVFSELTVLSFSHIFQHKAYWNVRCSCGKEQVMIGGHLKSGNTKSCGHIKLAAARANLAFAVAATITHGCSKTPEFGAWKDIKRRCLNAKYKQWCDYGGRGITICDRWIASFENFLADVGRRPDSSFSIDRIDNDGNYEPGNVRWATRSQQNANKSPKGTSQYRAKRLAR